MCRNVRSVFSVLSDETCRVEIIKDFKQQMSYIVF